MRRRQRERRPAGTAAATIPSSQGLLDSVPPERDARLTRARRHDYAVVVLAERADGVLTQQVYTNLPAAERKVRRTLDRGLVASLHLVRLVAVPWRTLDDLALDDLGGER